MLFKLALHCHPIVAELRPVGKPAVNDEVVVAVMLAGLAVLLSLIAQFNVVLGGTGFGKLIVQAVTSVPVSMTSPLV